MDKNVLGEWLPGGPGRLTGDVFFSPRLSIVLGIGQVILPVIR